MVAHMAFPALSGTAGQTGGVEHQTTIMARWLAARGHAVTVITWKDGESADTRLAGVRVLGACGREDGLPGLRFFTPRWTSLVRALRTAEAEVYYQNGAECVTGQVGLWCRIHRRAFVFSSASNADCEASLPLLPRRRERLLYRIGLRRADRIIVQTRTQQDQLRANFGRDAQVVPMPCVDAEGPPARTRLASRPRVVWIGRICAVKRPDRLLEIARRCGNIRFDLVGMPDDSAFAGDVVRQARLVPNVEVHGGLSRDRVDALLREAACVCCTSDIEGFPNTFLEAWSHGVPVLTTFDPDQLVAQRGLGWVAAPALFAERLNAVLADADGWAAASARARQYYLDHHTVDAVMPRFESIFAAAAAGCRD